MPDPIKGLLRIEEDLGNTASVHGEMTSDSITLLDQFLKKEITNRNIMVLVGKTLGILEVFKILFIF